MYLKDEVVIWSSSCIHTKLFFISFIIQITRQFKPIFNSEKENQNTWKVKKCFLTTEDKKIFFLKQISPMHWILPARLLLNSFFFLNVFPFVITSPYLMSMERYTSERFSDSTCVWTCSVKYKLSHTDCTFISTQKNCVHIRKILWNEAVKQIMPFSIEQRCSINTEMNVESSDNGYFPQTKTVFVVQFLKVRFENTSIPYRAVWQVNASPLALHTLKVCGWKLAS